MRVLAIETSAELASVALLVDEGLAAEISARLAGRHAETLLTQIEEVLRLAGVGREEIDLLAVGLGPGSFTGTRVGVATAKGLALGLERPLIGVSSLRAIARAASSGAVSVVVDAYKDEVYAASYAWRDGALTEVLEVFHASPAEAARRLPADVPVVGSAIRRYPAALGARALPRAFDAARATVVALEASERWARGERDSLAALEPLYVRGADAQPARVVDADRAGTPGREDADS